jgi:dTDP-4-amino-4,6-dideoxygalactose transaminase
MTASVRIPFLDLRRQTNGLRDQIDGAIDAVLHRGNYILGAEVSAFETEFAAACGARFAVGVASGTDALEIALRALEVGPGDEVVTQANTCVPTAAAILRTGATPVLCDVHPDTGMLDVESLAGALTERTRAVIPVHLYGQCADIDAIRNVTAARGVPIVEDCAQSHLAERHGNKAGTTGELGCFSFYPTKNLGALGDAGAVITQDERLASRVRALRNYGADRPGVNSRLDELQAAVLRVKLPYLEAWTERRAEIAAAYDAGMSDAPVLPLQALPGSRRVFHLYVVRSRSRDELREMLARRGIETRVHYPEPLHRVRAVASTVRAPVPLDNSVALAETVLSLPLYPQITDREVESVVECVTAA